MVSTCVETDDGWEGFKQELGVTYPTQEEDDMRHKLYLDSLVEIEKLSKEYPDTQFAPTKFSVMTKEEKKAFFGGGVKMELSPNLKSQRYAPKAKRSETFPSRFDWRDYGKVTPVLDQNPCGSCWAFSSTGMLDSAALIAGYDLKENISPQQLLDCIDESLLNKKYGKKSACNGGGNIAFASEYLSSTDRRYTISQYPVYKQNYFTRECAIDEIGKDPILIKLQHSIWGHDTEQEMKELITNFGPIGVHLYADSRKWEFAKGVGVLTKELCDAPFMDYNHAIMVVGWNDEYEYNGKKFKVWIIKNSWGTSVGDGGYYYIEMGRGACNIDLGKLFVIAFSGVDCESMSKDECKKEPGISCLWDDQTNKCTFDNMSYKDTEIIAQSLKDGRSQKLKDNAKVIAISVSLVFVGLIVVFIIGFCVYRPKQDNQVEM